MGNRIAIIGAGGHGKVVCDAILAQNEYVINGFVDVSLPVGTVVINGYQVIANQNNLESLKSQVDFFIVAIGDNKIRNHVFELAKAILKPAIVIHPSAVVGSDVQIGSGTVVLANSVINASSKIGENVIVNSRVVVDHDCVIGNDIHLSIGTMVGSNSKINNGYLSAIGENINAFSNLG
jgi:sugar O-acyltransferase (sialic acid O-acetyltransferase NeuD family)